MHWQTLAYLQLVDLPHMTVHISGHNPEKTHVKGPPVMRVMQTVSHMFLPAFGIGKHLCAPCIGTALVTNLQERQMK